MAKQNSAVGADTDFLIHPRKGRRESTLPPECLLLPNPADAKLAHQYLAGCGGQKGSLYHSQLTYTQGGKITVAGPSLGAAAAGLVLEKLIVRGVSECIVLSCCGSFDPGLFIGDILVPHAAVSGEGVTQYYASQDQLDVDQLLRKKIQQRLQAHKIDYQTGVIWSTDAPYRERRSVLNQLHANRGVCGVDMEFSALCAIAACRGVRLAGVFVVSDELWAEKWKPGFSDHRFRERSQHLFKTLISEPE